MKTNQPSWHCIINLGDATPEDHGGAFVIVDKRGIYDPELWILEPGEGEGEGATLCHIQLALCTRCKTDEDSLSDNRFHNDLPAWFGKAEDLESSASTFGMSAWALRGLLSNSNPIERAEGYRVLLGNYGAENFGGADPITWKESKALCHKLLRQIDAADKWKDGI